eukprot:g16047.t1
MAVFAKVSLETSLATVPPCNAPCTVQQITHISIAHCQPPASTSRRIDQVSVFLEVTGGHLQQSGHEAFSATARYGQRENATGNAYDGLANDGNADDGYADDGHANDEYATNDGHEPRPNAKWSFCSSVATLAFCSL